jgi:hypothetical protein
VINNPITNTWQQLASTPLVSLAAAYEILQQHWHAATHQTGLAWLPDTHSWLSVTLEHAFTIISPQS